MHNDYYIFYSRFTVYQLVLKVYTNILVHIKIILAVLHSRSHGGIARVTCYDKKSQIDKMLNNGCLSDICEVRR